jgi:hypothetical protein
MLVCLFQAAIAVSCLSLYIFSLPHNKLHLSSTHHTHTHTPPLNKKTDQCRKCGCQRCLHPRRLQDCGLGWLHPWQGWG